MPNRLHIRRTDLVRAKTAWDIEMCAGRTEETFGRWLLSRYGRIGLEWPELVNESMPAKAFALALKEVSDS
jgi:hypothetical protein